jgi:inosine-uridine nucleoside N-ribohydrolase
MTPQRIILDTDLAMGAPGSDIDDGFALALAYADPDIRLDLVTTVNGNTDVESATLLSLELLERLGCAEVPVVKGAAAPLTRPDRVHTAPAAIVERYGARTPAPGYAAVEIARHVMAHPGEITIVAIGPLTNIAAALALEPRLAAAAREIVIMGGVFLGHTNKSAMPGEFNVWTDPEAAEAVLHSGARIRWVGLDVTLQVRLTRGHARQMAAAPAGTFSAFAGEATERWIDHTRRRDPGDASRADSCAMHDPLAVAAVSNPGLLTWQDAYVGIVTGEGIARGVMVADLLTSAQPPEPNCRIATAVDVPGFTDHFLTLVSKL